MCPQKISVWLVDDINTSPPLFLAGGGSDALEDSGLDVGAKWGSHPLLESNDLY